MEIRGRRFIVTSGGGNPDPEPQPSGNTMSFSINFAAPPTSVSLTTTKYKFDKQSHVGFQWDDGVMRYDNPVIDYMQSLKYTDGCGNLIGYTAAMAINCGTGQFGDEGYQFDYYQQPEIHQFINIGWDFSNHGMIHSPSPTAYDDTIRLDNLIKLRTNYAMATTVVPTNFTGYTQAAFDLGYVMSMSQGDITGDAWRPIRIHQKMPVVEPTPPFYFMIRDFNDEWTNTSSTNNLKSEIDKFKTGQRDFELIGTHNALKDTAQLNGWKGLMEHIYTSTEDTSLVCSTREFLEYKQMKIQPITTEVQGNKLIVTVDISNLSVRNRWRDLSFKVTGGTITGVQSIEGISSTSFNASTGLVNIFNQKTVW